LRGYYRSTTIGCDFGPEVAERQPSALSRQPSAVSRQLNLCVQGVSCKLKSFEVRPAI